MQLTKVRKETRQEQTPSELDMVFACSGCGSTIPEVYAGTDTSDMLRDGSATIGNQDGSELRAGVVNLMWVSECGHVICKDCLVENVPFHHESAVPKVKCSLCPDHKPKVSLYWLRGLGDDEHHPSLPGDLFAQVDELVHDPNNSVHETIVFRYVNMERYATLTTKELYACQRELKRTTRDASKTQKKLDAQTRETEQLLAAAKDKDDELEKLKSAHKQLKKTINGTQDLVDALRETSRILGELGYGVDKVKTILDPFQQIVPNVGRSQSFVDGPAHALVTERSPPTKPPPSTPRQAASTPVAKQYSRASFQPSRTPSLEHKIPQARPAGAIHNVIGNGLSSSQRPILANQPFRQAAFRTSSRTPSIVQPTPERPGQHSFLSRENQPKASPRHGFVPPRVMTGVDPGVARLTIPSPRLKSSSAAVALAQTQQYMGSSPWQQGPVVERYQPGTMGLPEQMYMHVRDMTPTPRLANFEFSPPVYNHSSSSPLHRTYGDADVPVVKRQRLKHQAYGSPGAGHGQMGPPRLPASQTAYSRPMNRSHISASRMQTPDLQRQEPGLWYAGTPF